jgi:hypothetical protein
MLLIKPLSDLQMGCICPAIDTCSLGIGPGIAVAVAVLVAAAVAVASNSAYVVFGSCETPSSGPDHTEHTVHTHLQAQLKSISRRRLNFVTKQSCLWTCQRLLCRGH